jgi:hypothetical protein
VTGAVLDALESPRVQQALREGEDQHTPRRAELLEQIRDAQERREEARRDYSDRVIDRARLAGYPAAHRGRHQRRAARVRPAHRNGHGDE